MHLAPGSWLPRGKYPIHASGSARTLGLIWLIWLIGLRGLIWLRGLIGLRGLISDSGMLISSQIGL